MADKKARCVTCRVEFKAKKDGLPYAHKCVPALSPGFVAPFEGRKEEPEYKQEPEYTYATPAPVKGPCICVPDNEDPNGGLREDCPTHGAFEREEEPHPDESPKGPDHVHSFTWGDDGNGHEGSYCTGCGEPDTAALKAKRTLVSSSGRCDECSTVHAGLCPPVTERKPEHVFNDGAGGTWMHPGTQAGCALPECLPREDFMDPADECCSGSSQDPNTPADDFMDPDEPEPEKPKYNVSGQPEPRYETRGGQKIGYSCKDPRTGEFRTYKNGNPKGWTRATTFNKAATDQNNLTGWKQRNVLIGAALRPELVERAAGLTHEDDKRELMQIVGQLETVAGAKISADVGTEIHELTERWDGGQLSLEDAAAHQYANVLRLYQKALNDYELWPVPGLIERTVFCDLFGGVVGTFDRVYLHEPSGQYVIGDVKTGKTLEYGMDEIETQEWLYAYGINRYGVYDWNTDEWEGPWSYGSPGHPNQPAQVSEEWGVVIHLPVQGEQAGTCTVVGADLQRGKRYAEVCHQVRETRKAKPKPLPFDPAVLMPEPIPWESYFSTVTTKEEASSYWQQARAEGVDRMELARLVGLAQQRLREQGISS